LKRIAIVQSNYLPWKGYFDMIAAVDEFVLYDDVQFTRRDWRNRNRIKTPQGVKWLTVPVKVKGKYLQTIGETEVDGSRWAEKHWHALTHNYSRAACFGEVSALLEQLYETPQPSRLAAINHRLIDAICGYLGINTRITRSSDYRLVDGTTARLADICQQAGAGEYVSGPAARDYLDAREFAERGIAVNWFDYAGYPEYPQLWGEFVHEVSIVDLLFNCGRDAPRFMRFVRP
jgi:hypothetical protein